MVYTSMLCSTSVFSIAENKMVLEHQINILERFLKNHVTLKTEMKNKWKIVYFFVYFSECEDYDLPRATESGV